MDDQPRQPRNLQGLLKFAMEGELIQVEAVKLLDFIKNSFVIH